MYEVYYNTKSWNWLKLQDKIFKIQWINPNIHFFPVIKRGIVPIFTVSYKYGPIWFLIRWSPNFEGVIFNKPTSTKSFQLPVRGEEGHGLTFLYKSSTYLPFQYSFIGNVREPRINILAWHPISKIARKIFLLTNTEKSWLFLKYFKEAFSLE